VVGGPGRRQCGGDDGGGGMTCWAQSGQPGGTCLCGSLASKWRREVGLFMVLK
jgi:hypothetical protein